MVEPGNDTILGKRRQSGAAETGVLQKKVKFNPTQTKKKKRKRPRTKGIRETIKNELEKALQQSNSPIGHMFANRNDDGEPEAEFLKIVASLKLDKNKIAGLSTDAIIRISNLTTIFKIYESHSDKRLMVSYIPAHQTREACTVYIDNLPSACNMERLYRLLKKFGTVVSVNYPRTPSRRVNISGHIIEMGRKFKQFAFVQFTDKSAADNIVKEYKENSKFLTGKRRRHVPNIYDIRQKLKKLSARRMKRSRYELIVIGRLRRAYRLAILKERKERKKSVERKNLEISPRKSISESNGHRKSDLNNSMSRKPSNQNGIITSEKATKKKRKRVHRRRIHAPHYLPCSVNTYFKNVQVISYTQYQRLRTDYLDIRNSSSRLFKKYVRNNHILPERVNVYQGVIGFRDKLWSHREKDDVFVPNLRPYISPPAFSSSSGSSCFSPNPFDFRIDISDLLLRSHSEPPGGFLSSRRRTCSEPAVASSIDSVIWDPPSPKPPVPQVDPRLCPRLGSSLTLRTVSEGPIQIPLEYSEQSNRRTSTSTARTYIPLQSRNYDSDLNRQVSRRLNSSQSPPQENRIP